MTTPERAAVPGPAPAARSVGGAIAALPPMLAAIAEGAWVAAVYALVEALVHEPAPLGPVWMAGAALVGMLAARRLAPRLGPRWPRTALAIVIGAGVIGCLASPGALAALGRLDPGGAFGAHPGGLLLGLACFRGMAHADPSGSATSLERLVEIGLPALVLPALVAGMLQEPWRSEALRGIGVAAVIFIVAASTGMAVTRMVRLGVSGGFDWRRNRAWLLLVALLALGVVVAALPGAELVAPAIRLGIAVIALPLLLVGAVAGLGNISRRAALGLLVLAIVGLLFAALAPPNHPTDSDEGGSGQGAAEEGDPQLVTFAGGAILLLVVIGGVVILARLWMRDTVRTSTTDVLEERMIDLGPAGVGERAGRRWRPGGRAGSPPPGDAAGAYLALLHDLDGRETVRRTPSETPTEHAGRLRRDGQGSLSLELLAADYGLERFGGRSLAPPETRRALDRWRRLRGIIGR